MNEQLEERSPDLSKPGEGTDVSMVKAGAF